MRKQTFQHAEIRDENNEILQKGSYGKNTELVNATNTGVIDFIINNLEWLKNRVNSGNGTSIADYTFKIGNVKNGDVAQATSRIEDNIVYLDLVLPKGNVGDIYQENMIKLPDGTLIGIETKVVGENDNPTPHEPNLPTPKDEYEYIRP